MKIDDLKEIEKIETIGDASLERFFLTSYHELAKKYGFPGLIKILDIGDPDELWIECHTIQNRIYFKSGDVFIYDIKRGLVYDKASTPIGRNNIQEGVEPIKHHDLGCSCHYLDFLAVNNDKGFRANNVLFYYSLLWFLEENKNAELKITKKWNKRFGIRTSYWFKRRRAKLWYRAVNSIAGQGFYEKNLRVWHKQTSEFKHVKEQG